MSFWLWRYFSYISRFYQLLLHNLSSNKIKGSPCHSGCSGIYRIYRAFIKCCFTIYLGIKFASEDEIIGLILAIETVSKFNRANLLVESDLEYEVNLKENLTMLHGLCEIDG